MNDKVRISTKHFPLTPGVSQLLLKSKPSQYSQSDLKTYKSMLEFTSAHKKGFDPSGSIMRDDTNPKYRNIVKALFPPRGGAKQGGTLRKKFLQTDYMIHDRSKKANYTFWDDPNELVERLKLLIASQEAGHSGHNNEIISIIEELREANIIR